MSGAHRAAFFDRDGTLVDDAHYLVDAAAMRLVDGAPQAIGRLNAAGIVVVVATNQSGIAQGLITPQQYEQTRQRLEALMREAGARIDATLHCPHHPLVSGPCDCRKPGLGLFRRAAREMDLDLGGSLYVGDRLRDVTPGLMLGGLALLVPSVETPREELEHAERAGLVASSVGSAVERYLATLAPADSR